jgi:hypothetical protein
MNATLPDKARMNKCEKCGRKFDTGFRGLITLLIVLLTFGLAYVQVIKGDSETLIPPWVGVILGSVGSTYFMSKTGERMREITHEQAEKNSNPSVPASPSTR